MIQNGLTRPTSTKDRGEEEVRTPQPRPIISHGAPSRRGTRLSDGKARSANGSALREASPPIEGRARTDEAYSGRAQDVIFISSHRKLIPPSLLL